MEDVEQLSGVIGSFYEAALDPDLWDGLATRIARAFDASSAVLKTYGPSGELELLEATDNLHQSPADQALADHWHRNDLWVERSAAYGAGRVIVGHELVPPSELEETGYYRDWLRRMAIYDVVGGVVDVGGGLGVLGVHRDRNEATLGVRERRAAAILLPHMERALRMRARLSATCYRASLAALETSGLAVIVVTGPQRHLAFVNAAGEAVLARTPELSTAGGLLRAADPAFDARLAAAVARALANARGGLEPPPAGMPMPRVGRCPLMLVATPMPARVGEAAEPGVLLLLRDPEATMPGVGYLQEVFGLTAAEAGVAAGLCRGGSLAQIATEFGIGLSTVRSHLKSVMLKTHTRRQAELVALLLGASR